MPSTRSRSTATCAGDWRVLAARTDRSEDVLRLRASGDPLPRIKSLVSLPGRPLSPTLPRKGGGSAFFFPLLMRCRELNPPPIS